MIDADRYTIERFHHVPAAAWLDLDEALPAGHRITLTHGGSEYTGRLWRGDELVLLVRRSSLASVVAGLTFSMTHPVLS